MCSDRIVANSENAREKASGTLLLICRALSGPDTPISFLSSGAVHTGIWPGLVWCVSMLGVGGKTWT